MCGRKPLVVAGSAQRGERLRHVEVERADEVGNDDIEVRRSAPFIFEPLTLPKLAKMFSLAGARVYDGRGTGADAIDRQVWRYIARVEGVTVAVATVSAYVLNQSGRQRCRSG